MTFLADMIYDRHFGRHPFLPGAASVETDAKAPLKQPPARHSRCGGMENGRNRIKNQKNATGITMPCGHSYMIMTYLSE